MRTNYVLIDYENVQPTSLAGLDAEHFRVLVFVGASQNKLTFDTAAAVQKLGARAEYIKIAGNGSNALDFHIAFHIGHWPRMIRRRSSTSSPKTLGSTLSFST